MTSDSINVIVSTDQVDLEFLGTINAKPDKMIMLPIIVLQPPAIQQALYRAIVGGWIRLVDLQQGQRSPAHQPETMRVFQMTADGQYRLEALTVSVTN